jgi:hypothetical protein
MTMHALNVNFTVIYMSGRMHRELNEEQSTSWPVLRHCVFPRKAFVWLHSFTDYRGKDPIGFLEYMLLILIFMVPYILVTYVQSKVQLDILFYVFFILLYS